jgi:excinuclease ABC subunit C
MVVWIDGKMRKSEYRSFNIRGLEHTDDFFSIHQAVERRYRRRLSELGDMPDLILIDGGRGQLNAALQALTSLGVEETPIVALAKQEEEIYTPDSPAPLRLPRTDRGLMILQQVRDEAHRFAVSRHRLRRKNRTLRSGFDDLSGIGPKRKRLLVRRFGSFRGVEQAPIEELIEVLGERLGRSVHDQLLKRASPDA